MKRIAKFRMPVISLMVLVLLIPSCKGKKVFVDPAYIFLKWTSAVKNLNYTSYSECEAFPKADDVFRALYGGYYYTDMITRDMDPYNENDMKFDFEGKRINYRTVYFECNRVDRKTGKVIEKMKGDVDFIKYVDEPGSLRGWLMYNRTFIRTGISEQKDQKTTADLDPTPATQPPGT